MVIDTTFPPRVAPSTDTERVDVAFKFLIESGWEEHKRVTDLYGVEVTIQALDVVAGEQLELRAPDIARRIEAVIDTLKDGQKKTLRFLTEPRYREGLIDEGIRWGNSEKGQYGTAWMCEHLPTYLEERHSIPQGVAHAALDQRFALVEPQISRGQLEALLQKHTDITTATAIKNELHLMLEASGVRLVEGGFDTAIEDAPVAPRPRMRM